MSMMNPEIKQKWVDALRSGRYEQDTRSSLLYNSNSNSFCCLGVLCDIRREETGFELNSFFDEVIEDIAVELLPPDIVKWAGLKEEILTRVGDGFDIQTRGNEYSSLSAVNDSGRYSFKQIANIIEEEL